MATDEGRPFDVRRPWPTAPIESGRVAWLLVLVAVSQFILNAFEHVWTPRVMFWLWMVGAVAVGLASRQIERYFDKRRRMGR